MKKVEKIEKITLTPRELRRFDVPENTIKTMIGKVHTFRFQPGERMVFHLWKNKYQSTENYQNLFDNPWCPLFGVLPFNDPTGKTAVALIQKLRTFFGIPAHIAVSCPEAYPDQKVIFELTGFPETTLLSARNFFSKSIAVLMDTSDENAIANEPHTNDEINLVNGAPLLEIAYLWSTLKFHYIDGQGKHGDMFKDTISKVAREIANNGVKYAFGHGKCEVARKALEGKDVRSKASAYRTSKSTKGKLDIKESKKEIVKKIYDNKFKSDNNLNLLSKSKIAVDICAELKNTKNRVSLNTMITYLNELHKDKKICLPQKET